MNIIVLVKQVPDVSNIPAEAWDREKGTLKRNLLEAVFNPLDLQALTFACRMRDLLPEKGRVVALTMGPPMARGMLEDALARGADEAVLLTDMKFAGADTPATAFALAQAVRRISRDIFKDEKYIIVSGMQSVDGDTAQVPPQIAEELGIEHIAYARGVEVDADGTLRIERVGPEGLEVLSSTRYPYLVTVIRCMDALNRSFQRTRAIRLGQGGKVQVWDAAAVDAPAQKIGLKGSRTWVSRVFSSSLERAKPCVFPEDMGALLEHLKKDYQHGCFSQEAAAARYDLAGKQPTYHGEVWVYGEVNQGRLTGVTLELVAKARELADVLHEKVAVVLLGDDERAHAPALFAAGADKVYLAEHPLLKEFLPIPYKKTVAAMAAQYKPQIILLGATTLGRELGPRIAYALSAGLTADCTGLEIGDQAQGKDMYVAALKQTRPALGGNIMATILTKDSPFQMATVRAGVFTALQPTARAGEVVQFTPQIEADDIRLACHRRSAPAAEVHLEHADIIIAGGRGMGSRAAFEEYARPLAEALGSLFNTKVELAGSRMAVEDGFIAQPRQVGQTGQTVAPKLYVALGISGAVQHVAGMQRSGLILSVNKDPQARMYKHSDYGVVGSVEDVVLKLINAIKGGRHGSR